VPGGERKVRWMTHECTIDDRRGVAPQGQESCKVQQDQAAAEVHKLCVSGPALSVGGGFRGNAWEVGCQEVTIGAR